MDCRQTLVLALGLVVSNTGCFNHSVVSTTPTIEATAANVRKERDLPKRPPQASTCVAFGNFSEGMAADADRSPQERDRLRDQARKAYQQALEIDRQNLSALMALARHYVTIDDQERALATYGKAVQAHPKQASAWSELGMCHARKKDWEPALQYLRKAVELEPENRQATNALGFCLARAGDYEESLAVFKKNGNAAEAHYNLARMLHHLNHSESSRQQAQLALQLNPELTAARQFLAELDGSATPTTAQTTPEGQAPAENPIQPASLTGSTSADAPAGRGER